MIPSFLRVLYKVCTLYSIVHMFQSTFQQSFFIMVSRCLQNTSQSAGAHIYTHARAHSHIHKRVLRFTLFTLNPNPLFCPYPLLSFTSMSCLTFASTVHVLECKPSVIYNSLYWENCPTPQLSATKENKLRYLLPTVPPHPTYLIGNILKVYFWYLNSFDVLHPTLLYK